MAIGECMWSVNKLPAILAAILLSCSQATDYIYLVDTSGSMIKGETLKKVQESVPELVQNAQEDDRVSVLPFDEKVHPGKSFLIETEADRQAVVEYVRSLKPSGQSTDMATMLRTLQSETARLTAEDKRVVVVLLTDGRDDPAQRRKKFELSEIRDEEATGNNPYIYYVNLARLQDPALEATLKDMSSRVKTVAGDPGSTDPGASTGLAEVSADIGRSRMMDLLESYGLYALLALVVLLFLGGLFFLIHKWLYRHKPVGELKYYEDGVNFPNKLSFHLDRQQGGKFKIGQRMGNNLRIKQLGLPQEFSFKGGRSQGEPVLKARGKPASLIEYRVQKKKGVISPGDKFKIGNYIFEYVYEKAK